MSVGQHKSKLKKNKQNEIMPQNRKVRSVSAQLYGAFVESSSSEKSIPQHTDKDLENYLCIDTGASIPIVA